MMEIIRATPLYEFLRQCDASPLAKKILDCGAGGAHPPLSLIYQHAYETYGIEIAEEPLALAQGFCAEKNMPLNIIRGDMRRIPFPSEWFSFVYSFNAIDFVTKPDTAVSMREIERVLRPNGLCCVNFLSVDDRESWQPFCETLPAMELLKSERFTHYEDDEADEYFTAFDILRKVKRLVDKVYEGKKLQQAGIEYIARKR
jgi:ubiquinone/menaquinone biosynthesis C-methylase UbiE